jgi:putative CocE/NonD family hydrolase
MTPAGFTWKTAAAALALLTALPATQALAQAPAAASFGHYAPPEQFSETVTTSLYLPMRDGVRLAVSVTRPARGGKPIDGKFPVIWQHTLGIAGAGAQGGPLGDDPAQKGYRGFPNMARYGYAVVQVARRANGPSFGRRRGYNDRTEAYDAYEIIDWLATQPWSTGDVGVYGCSNTGDAAMHAVTVGNPHLKAAWAGCFSFEKYDGFLRGGIFANWGTGPERTIAQDMSNVPVQGDESKVLLRQAAEEHQGAFPLAKMWAAMPYRDSWAEATQSRFWYEGSAGAYLNQINRSGTAVYVQGGWADDLRNQGLVAWANLKNDRHIVIGPWGHCGNGDFDLFAEMHRFFDAKLKGIDTNLGADDPIHYFTINAPAGTEWRGSKTWPIAGVSASTWYLGQGALQPRTPTAKAIATSFTVRYDVGCPEMVKRYNEYLTGAPPCPLAHAGPHFAGPVLRADTEVTGDAVADLWITSTAKDSNIFVYLEDVAPDGTVTSVTDARLKASLRRLNKPKYANFDLPWHRAHAEDAQDLTPGEPARLTMAFLPASYVFKAGHRIQVSVAGADYRERDRTPVTPAPVLTILNDAAHPSAVTLPIAGAR